MIIEEIESEQRAKVKFEDGKICSKRIKKLIKFDQGILNEAKKIERNIQTENGKLEALQGKLVRLVEKKPKQEKKATGANGKANGAKTNGGKPNGGKAKETKAQNHPKQDTKKKAA